METVCSKKIWSHGGKGEDGLGQPGQLELGSITGATAVPSFPLKADDQKAFTVASLGQEDGFSILLIGGWGLWAEEETRNRKMVA